ncbi:MAG TPA: hypothetical protein VK985_09575 [Rariglobus sp.]|nr:hypothetical protein [Rariglobus sp.]
MSLAYQLSIAGPGLTAPQRLKSALQPQRLSPVVGRAGVNVTRAHLFEKNRTAPNALGGRRTNYYAAAGRSTSFAFAGDDAVVVSISQIGISLRYYGGTVKPKKAKFLTIPVAPEAHGKRAREFGNLELVFGPNGQPWALATKGDRRVQITTNAKGKIVKKLVGRRGVILFRLVKSVTQAADPSVLPLPDVLMGAVVSATNAHIERALKPPGNPSAS